jgi:hypothetical protein
MADAHLAPNIDSLDHPTIKTWVEAGIPLVIPGSLFRRMLPMGTTHFYQEIKDGRLRAVKLAGGAGIPIEEAIRYKSTLPRMSAAAA